MTLTDRLESALRHARMTQTALAERLGVHRQTITAVKLGKIGPDRIMEIAEILGVDPRWLATGTGEAPPWWAGEQLPDSTPESELALSNLTQELREARTIIRALTQQLSALELENQQQAERIAALERDRQTRSPRVAGQ